MDRTTLAFIHLFSGVLIVFGWFWGMVLAKGVWSTFFAVVFCPWSFYLVVEKIVTLLGLN